MKRRSAAEPQKKIKRQRAKGKSKSRMCKNPCLKKPEITTWQCTAKFSARFMLNQQSEILREVYPERAERDSSLP
ncbi:MAG: hypothetical protein ABSA59_14385 [Terriglobia bacterium]|jgi:hypothetical protein